MEKLNHLAEWVTLCNRCGTCQSVCPTYKVTRDEFQVARGRVRTIRQVIDKRFEAIKGIPLQVDQCLLCGACTESCPSSVPTGDILQQVRAELMQEKGFSLFHSLVYRGVLDRQDRLEKIGGLVRLLDRTPLRNAVAQHAAARALPLVRQAVTALPRGLSAPARSRLGKAVQSSTATGRVCYFMGCGTNTFTPEVGVCVVDMLERLSFEVCVPDVPCCGGPHFSAGDMAKARRLARENISKITALDPAVILTDCATCAHTLHQYPSFFEEGDPIREKAMALAEKLVDIHEFLGRHLASANRTRSLAKPLRVTYHDPCHGVRGLKVKASPRELLKAIPGVDFVEMEGADSCCGGAGSYAFRHPGMSQKILDNKVDAIAATGADVVATSCPSCFMQISAGLWRHGLRVQVTHPVRLAAKLLGIDPETMKER